MKDYTNINRDLRLKIIKIRELEKVDKKGASALESELVVSLSYLIHSITNRYRNDIYYDDLLQEGMIGLIRAVRSYNCELTFHFVRYAMWWIKTAIRRFIEKNKKRNNLIISNLLQFTSDTDEINNLTPEYQILNNEIEEQIINFINGLPNNQQCILGNMLDVKGFNNKTYQQICTQMKVSRKKLKSIKKQLINDIRCWF